MKYKSILNYFGQLRLYSFLDIIILATALTKNLNAIIGITILWLSFLLYLESRHKDEPRLKVNQYLWLAPFLLSLILLPIWICLGFALFSYLYTNKKKNKFPIYLASLLRAYLHKLIHYTAYGRPHLQIAQQDTSYLPPSLSSQIPQKGFHFRKRAHTESNMFGACSSLQLHLS